MYTQFFGSYLLSKKIVSAENLKKALEKKDTTRVKLGVMAINAGYMTAKQVDEVHKKQATVDKRIGDIAIELGYLTAEQVDELLSMQKTGCLLLGQALVDMGCLTNEEFEQVLNAYKAENNLTDSDFTEENNQKAEEVISSFYSLKGQYSKYCSEYVNILFKNIIRFIGDDFTPLLDTQMSSSDFAVVQNITGEFSALTAITANDSAAVEFASRFAEEKLTDNDEYTKDVISEFLNLNNGLYTVNISDISGKELGLTPQTTSSAGDVAKTKSKAYVNIPLEFSFGIVTFNISVLN